MAWGSSLVPRTVTPYFRRLPMKPCLNPFGRLIPVAWCLAACLAATAGDPQAPSVRLNTLGYLPGMPKRASIAGPAHDFAVVRMSDGHRVLEGTVGEPVLNPDTGETLATVDFSHVYVPGEYRLLIDEGESSPPFRIADDLYHGPFRTVTRAMYLWRCGMAVRGEHGSDVFAHDACHLEDAWLDYVGGGHTRKESVGGWHDAGDYNKYVVNAGVTVGAMFRAWEDFRGAIARIELDLPQTGAFPPFLSELKWETDWLLTMQAEDGSVFHKLSTTNFGAMILPERETAERFFTPWSSAATADFVAMLAQAARNFRPYDADYANRCLEAARRSYDFLLRHPENTRADLTGFRTGAYATRDTDDRLWAAAELWETTGERSVLDDLERRIRANQFQVDEDFDWGSVGNLGVITYLASGRAGRDLVVVRRLEETLLEVADRMVQSGDRHGYGRPLGTRYYWGCNGSVARQVLVLQAAYRLRPTAPYRAVALDALNHLFGRNVYGRSFVTGLGHRPPRQPHDRRSAGDAVEAPWPGYLIGGPHPKATDWKDAEEDYRTNEIAINWNGALIYALAAFLDRPVAVTRAPEPVPSKEPDVIYVPTPQKVVDRMLELGEVKAGDVLYDLGCGDGRIMVTAAKRYGIRAVGFDIDPDRIRESLENVRTNGVEHLVSVRQEDIFNVDLREANVVTLYLLPSLNVRLMPQLAELRPGSRIVSHDFDMEGAKPLLMEEWTVQGAWEDAPEFEESQHTLYKWVVPWEPEP